MARKQRKVRRNISRGIAYIKATFNNTVITIADTNGEALCQGSGGTVGFKGARKSTPFAATKAAESVAAKARKFGMSEIEIRLRGTGPGREAAATALANSGLRVSAIEDHTPVPHNGCRSRKKRRV
jgi:small subunit ribosomal protein S11